MSGEKRVPITIMADELMWHLQEMEEREMEEERWHASLRNARWHRHREQDEYERERQERNSAHRELLENLNSGLHQMEEEFLEQQEQLQALQVREVELQGEINNLKERTEEELKKQRDEYTQLIAQNREQVNQVKSQIANILQREAANQQSAQVLIEDLEKLIAHTESNLPHEKFAPGQLEKVRRQVEAAKAHIENAPQTSIATGQQAYFDLVDLREEVLEKEAEFNLWLDNTLEAMRALFESIAQNRQVVLKVDEDEVAEKEVDFWTRGAYQALAQQVEALKKELEENRKTISLERIKEIFDTIEGLQKQQRALLKESIERVVSSQARAEIGDVIVETLENEGFTLEESGYEQSDERNTYLIKVVNRAGTEIVAAIVPDDATNTNTVSVNTFDKNVLSDQVTAERFEGIRKALVEAGLQVGQTTCEAAPLKELYDIDEILNEKGGGIPKNVLEKAEMLNGQTAKNKKN